MCLRYCIRFKEWALFVVVASKQSEWVVKKSIDRKTCETNICDKIISGKSKTLPKPVFIISLLHKLSQNPCSLCWSHFRSDIEKNLPSWFWLSRFVFVMKMIKILLFGLTLRNFNSAIFFGSINMLLLVLRLLESKTRKKQSQNTRKLWLTNKNSTLNKTISEINRSETYWWYISQYPSLLVEGMFKKVMCIWYDTTEEHTYLRWLLSHCTEDIFSKSKYIK